MSPLPQASTDSDDDCIKRVPDYIFRCSYCIKLIAEDSPVYMRQDHSYCTLACRNKGLSRLFSQLKENQIEEAIKKSAGSLAQSGDRAHSDCSIASRTTMPTVTDSSNCGDDVQPGVLARFGQALMNAVLQRVASRAWGEQALRTYSSGMLWGKEFTKNHSSAQMLFEYMPEVDRYLSQSTPFHHCLSAKRLDVLAC